MRRASSLRTPVLLIDLLERVSREIEDRVRTARDRSRTVLRDAIRAECRLAMKTDADDTGASAQVPIDVAPTSTLRSRSKRMAERSTLQPTLDGLGRACNSRLISAARRTIGSLLHLRRVADSPLECSIRVVAAVCTDAMRPLVHGLAQAAPVADRREVNI